MEDLVDYSIRNVSTRLLMKTFYGSDSFELNYGDA